MKRKLDTIPHEAVTTSTEVMRWVGELECLHTRISPRFARREPHRRAIDETSRSSRGEKEACAQVQL